MEKPYRLPDPMKQPDSFLVILYKTLKCIPYDDRAWDKLYFARGMKRTQELLEVFSGDVKQAAECLRGLKDRFESDGLGWTIETVIQYSFEWRSQHQSVNDRDCLRSLVGAYQAQGIEPLALKVPAPALAIAPVCAHEGYVPKAGVEYICFACGEKMYQPTETELRKLKIAIQPKRVAS